MLTMIPEMQVVIRLSAILMEAQSTCHWQQYGVVIICPIRWSVTLSGWSKCRAQCSGV